MSVYKVNFVVDDFRSLISIDPVVNENRLMALDGIPKSDQWPDTLPVVFDNEDAPEPAIYSCGAGNMLLHGKAWDVLNPILEPFSEFLPVSWNGGSGYIVNTLGFSDCLDLDNTVWHVAPTSGKRLFIKDHVFLDDRLPEQPLFRIEPQRFATFCSDSIEDGFFNLVIKHGLDGCTFTKVWT